MPRSKKASKQRKQIRSPVRSMGKSSKKRRKDKSSAPLRRKTRERHLSFGTLDQTGKKLSTRENDRGDRGTRRGSGKRRLSSSDQSMLSLDNFPDELIDFIVRQLPVKALLNVSEINTHFRSMTKERRDEMKEEKRLKNIEATNNHFTIKLDIDPNVYNKSISLVLSRFAKGGKNYFLPNFNEKIEELTKKLQKTFDATLVLERIPSFVSGNVYDTDTFQLSHKVQVPDKESLEKYAHVIYSFMEQMMIKGSHHFYLNYEGYCNYFRTFSLTFRIATETTLKTLHDVNYYTEFEFDQTAISNAVSTLLF